MLAALVAPLRSVVEYTTRGGLVVTSDGANYLWAAARIADGTGVVGTDGEPLTMFPPGFPVMIALVDVVLPGNAGFAVLVLNCVALFGVAVTVGVAAARSGARWWSPVVAAAVGLSAPMQLSATAAWSEPLALCLSAWAFVALQQALARHQGSPGSQWLVVAAGVLAGYAAMVRTSALFWAAGLALACWLGRRWLSGLLLGAIAAAPAAMWALRNQLAHGDAAGARGVPILGPVAVVRDAARTAAGWFSLDGPGVWQAIGLVCLLGVSVLVIRSRPGAAARAAVTVTVVVAAATVAVSCLVAMDGLNDRLMAQVLLGLALVVATTIGRWRRESFDRAVAAVVAFGVLLGSWHGVTIAAPKVAIPGDLSCDFPAADRLLSDMPAELAHHCDRIVHGAPRERLYASSTPTTELAELAAVQAAACVRIVWIGSPDGGFRHSVADLESIGFTAEPGPGWLLLSSDGCR